MLLLLHSSIPACQKCDCLGHDHCCHPKSPMKLNTSSYDREHVELCIATAYRICQQAWRGRKRRPIGAFGMSEPSLNALSRFTVSHYAPTRSLSLSKVRCPLSHPQFQKNITTSRPRRGQISCRPPLTSQRIEAPIFFLFPSSFLTSPQASFLVHCCPAHVRANSISGISRFTTPYVLWIPRPENGNIIVI
ncbi:hypothetical protein BC826DRAFT_598911 [Russula brevipes]|nr:hypothetical protein BC826DRAFT_598911 [Russula brevipes]